MKDETKPTLVLHAVEAFYSLIVLLWVLFPLFSKAEGIMPTLYLPFRKVVGAPAIVSGLWSIAVFIPALVALFKLAAYFIEDFIPAAADPRRTLASILSFVESTLVILAIAFYVVEYAKSPAFFSAASPLLYVVFVLSVAFNAFFVYQTVDSWSRRSDSYKEYLRYRYSSVANKTVKELTVRLGIQTKLLLFFLPLVIVIIVALFLTLMSNFSRTIIGSVNDKGKLLADTTANVISSNPTDQIAIDDYILAAAKKNAASAIPFHDVSYIKRDSKTNAFIVAASTDPSLVAKPVTEKVEPFTETIYIDDAASKEYEFRAPVHLSSIFLGYVKVDYARDVIFEQFFRTQIKAGSFALLFIYLSIFFTVIIGRTIVLPILYLRMSVSSISMALSSMIKGEKRISAELLQFADRVETRDEIKGLSSEVGNMTAVIRGIVPYISASTLKHSERTTPSTEERDLCFLFTDIRGFTSLSEGMTPDKIVEMLNHYLDIQSSIILANHGDVDKFVGDETMAMFEGPDKELNAVKTSLAIRKAMAEEKEKAIAAKMNVVSIGIGINSGPVAFGSVGAKDRMDFTSIGDTVNLAARLEGANKPYGTKTLVTKSIYDQVKEAYLCREIDLLAVKGKKVGVSVYEVIQSRDIAGAHLFDLCKSFEEGLAFYRGQKWAKAEKIFVGLVEKYKDEASSTFLGRIALFKSNPPPVDWDGVFVMTVK